MNFDRKHVPAALQEFFAGHPRVALAFSSGCDSAYLYYAARACGAEICAYYVRSQFQPAFELEDALRLAPDMKIIELDVLVDARVKKNPADRCYFCKQAIFSAILAAARADGFACIIDGTNASDDASDRPGMRALREMQVLSPLRSCGVTKAQLRELSRDAGLFTWNKPAYACLATRIPTGTEIRDEMLQRVERAEAALAALGFSDFRVRLQENAARLELTVAGMDMLMERREEVLSALEADFDGITLDLRPRKGMEI